MKNANTRESLEKIRTTVLENLAAMPPAPSAQMAPVPPKLMEPVRAAAAPVWVGRGVGVM
jgi:histone deacetylase 1/2